MEGCTICYYETTTLVWFTIYAGLPDGREERSRTGSYSNREEVEKVVEILQQLQLRCRNSKIVVISFYQAQIRLIKETLARRGVANVHVHSVDSFQGSESDVVVVSFVRTSRNVGFLNDYRRLNVAITRAKIFSPHGWSL